MGDRHFVLRHRPGFIGANNGRAAERLNRGQLPDDRLLPDHPLHAERQSDRDNGRQPFRYGSDGKGNSR